MSGVSSKERKEAGMYTVLCNIGAMATFGYSTVVIITVIAFSLPHSHLSSRCLEPKRALRTSTRPSRVKEIGIAELSAHFGIPLDGSDSESSDQEFAPPSGIKLYLCPLIISFY